MFEKYAKELNKLNNLSVEAVKTKNFIELEKYCLSEEYQSLPYSVKNYYFITSSKLKAFEKCPLAYKFEYIDLVEKPDGMDDKDYFVVGRALDDRLTMGEEYYGEKYKVVSRRSENIDFDIAECKSKIEASKLKLNKDGSRSKVGENEETTAETKIKYLEVLKSKTQMTETMARLVDQMKDEFLKNKMFNPTPTKKVFFMEYAGMLIKIELDDFDGTTIRDVKSASSVLNFDPENYDIQSCLYHWVVEENTMIRAKVLYEVVDKYTYFSRSACWEYTQDTLMANRARITALLQRLKESMELGLFIQSSDAQLRLSSPYYGYQGYGRPTEPFYY